MKGAVVGFGWYEHNVSSSSHLIIELLKLKYDVQLDIYEVLVVPSEYVEWCSVSGKLNVEALKARPVPGGYDTAYFQHAPLYIVQAFLDGEWHLGKTSASLPGQSTELF